MARKALLILSSVILLMQGLADAWAAPMLPAAARDAAKQEQAQDSMGGHCIGERSQDVGTCCCADHCSCPQACGLAPQVLPAQMSELDELLAEHFEAVRNLAEPLPAHFLTPLRPPISSPG